MVPCCEVGCNREAVFEIRDGEAADDFTHACAGHVGDLLDPSKVGTVYGVPRT